jgi:hypothetical protein
VPVYRTQFQWLTRLITMWKVQYETKFNKSNSMEHNPSGEANSFTASREITHILRNAQVYYCIRKGLPTVPILS